MIQDIADAIFRIENVGLNNGNAYADEIAKHIESK